MVGLCVDVTRLFLAGGGRQGLWQERRAVLVVWQPLTIVASASAYIRSHLRCQKRRGATHDLVTCRFSPSWQNPREALVSARTTQDFFFLVKRCDIESVVVRLESQSDLRAI